MLSVSVLWGASVLFTKLSILLMLSELFSVVRYMYLATRIGSALAIATFVAQTIADLTVCLPISHWWSIQAIAGRCGHQQVRVFVAASIVHTITDFVILFLPIPCLWALRLPVKTRVGLMLVFSAGIL